MEATELQKTLFVIFVVIWKLICSQFKYKVFYQLRKYACAVLKPSEHTASTNGSELEKHNCMFISAVLLQNWTGVLCVWKWPVSNTGPSTMRRRGDWTTAIDQAFESDQHCESSQ